MSFKDGEMHVVAAFGAVVLSAALVVPTVWFASSANASTGPVLEEMEAIEASIAYKKAPAKQPQKKTQAPPPEVKPEGVSRDETKKPDEKKPDEPKPDKPVPKDPLAAVPDRRPDDDTEMGTPTTSVGDFNDNDRGFAEESKGDPFFQRVARDINESWEFPKILDAQGTAIGCLHILADGKIAKIKLDQKSGDASLDDSAERALKKVEKLRSATPEAVPTHLLKAATTRWICFKFNPQRASE